MQKVREPGAGTGTHCPPRSTGGRACVQPSTSCIRECFPGLPRDPGLREGSTFLRALGFQGDVTPATELFWKSGFHTLSLLTLREESWQRTLEHLLRLPEWPRREVSDPRVSRLQGPTPSLLALRRRSDLTENTCPLSREVFQRECSKLKSSQNNNNNKPQKQNPLPLPRHGQNPSLEVGTFETPAGR